MEWMVDLSILWYRIVLNKECCRRYNLGSYNISSVTLKEENVT